MPNSQIQKFFDSMEAQGLMLTYGDVRLRSHHSDILPTETDLTTRLSRTITLKVPIVSSPMDTVTESRMAIAMAEAGGIGIIHRGLPPEKQAKEVGKVKHRLHGKIETPITVQQDETVQEALKRREEKGYVFHSFPVIAEGKVVGLVSGSDFEFCESPSQRMREIMTPLASLTAAQPSIDAHEAYALMCREKKKVLPLIDAHNRLQGMYIFSDLKRIFSGSHSSHSVDSRGQLLVAAAVGAGEGAIERAALLAKRQCDAFAIDTAHGDTGDVIKTVERLKADYPKIDVFAGNVSSGASARRLADAGADAVIVGQGPGSICTTRIVAGIGVPQVSAVYECALALEGTGVPVIADGGIDSSGDIVIALAVGASGVILGRLLAGTEESPGETRLYQGVQVKDYRGMGSQGAMRDNQSSRERYGQGALTISKLVPEGVEGIVPYRGPVKALLDQYSGGIRSGLGYHGARDISGLRTTAEIFRISNAGLNESHPHDVTITAQAPNYSGR